MKKEALYRAIGDISEQKLAESELPVKKKHRWVKWGAMAACVCLVIGGIVISQVPGFISGTIPGGGPDVGAPGGNFPDGVDPIIASVAVFPGTEDVRDVENATIESVNESQVYSMELIGTYLPTSLPADYHFGKASLYETTMKNGTQYHMLRVTYSTGDEAPTGDTAPNPDVFGNSFIVFVMDYKPDTKRKIYAPGDITEGKLEEIGGLTFHLNYGEVYVGISPNDASPSEIMIALESITANAAGADAQ